MTEESERAFSSPGWKIVNWFSNLDLDAGGSEEREVVHRSIANQRHGMHEVNSATIIDRYSGAQVCKVSSVVAARWSPFHFVQEKPFTRHGNRDAIASDGARLLGAQIFFWARVAYAGLYIGGIAWARTAAWGVSMIGLLIILWQLL